jgi:hypothetical protein
LTEPTDEELLEGQVSRLHSSPDVSLGSSNNWPITEKEGEVM